MRSLLLMFALSSLAAAETRVTVVSIQDEVDSSTVYLVKRSLEQARTDHSSLTVFEINTPGGRVDAALDIADLIDKAGMPTAAYVKAGNFGGAQSAGALISIACGRIVMQPGSSIGSAQPVRSDGVMASEKVLSWVAAQFRSRAEKKGLQPLIAAGMVDPDLEIRDIETADGGHRLVDGPQFEQLEQSGAKPKVLRVVKAKGKLLNLTASEAKDLGISLATTDSLEGAYAYFGVAPESVVRIQHAWSESAVAFVTSGLVTGILIALGFIFIWVECKTPGVGVPALLAAACFGTVFFTHYLLGQAQAAEIAIFALGATLLVVEFLTPGFGIVGALGLVLMLGGLVLSLQNFILPSNPYQWNSLVGNFLTLTASTGFAVLGFGVLVRFLPHAPMFEKIVLKSELASGEAHPAGVLVGRIGVALTALRPSGKAEVDGMTVDVIAEEGFVEKGGKVTVLRAEGPSVVVVQTQQDLRAGSPQGLFPGMEGTAVTPLRPTGVALLNGNRTDVLTAGEPVDNGAQIRVVSVEGNRVVVAPVERRIG